MRMFNPPHPGEVLREDVLPHLGLTVTDAAAALGVTRPALSRVLNGQAAISTEMALRLEKWLGAENGGSADAWIAQQVAYDLWRARKELAPKIARIMRAGPSAKKRGKEHAAAKGIKR
jgi:addiction module HigA family antidote